MLAITGYRLPEPADLLILLLGGVMLGLGQAALFAATRSGNASQIAPAAYSPLFWALAVGAWMFGEIPDMLALVGTMGIATAGVANVLTGRGGSVRRVAPP